METERPIRAIEEDLAACVAAAEEAEGLAEAANALHTKIAQAKHLSIDERIQAFVSVNATASALDEIEANARKHVRAYQAELTARGEP